MVNEAGIPMDVELSFPASSTAQLIISTRKSGLYYYSLSLRGEKEIYKTQIAVYSLKKAVIKN